MKLTKKAPPTVEYNTHILYQESWSRERSGLLSLDGIISKLSSLMWFAMFVAFVSNRLSVVVLCAVAAINIFIIISRVECKTGVDINDREFCLNDEKLVDSLTDIHDRNVVSNLAISDRLTTVYKFSFATMILAIVISYLI